MIDMISITNDPAGTVSLKSTETLRKTVAFAVSSSNAVYLWQQPAGISSAFILGLSYSTAFLTYQIGCI